MLGLQRELLPLRPQVATSVSFKWSHHLGLRTGRWVGHSPGASLNSRILWRALGGKPAEQGPAGVTPGPGQLRLPASRTVSKGVLRAHRGCLAGGLGGQPAGAARTVLDLGVTQASSGSGRPGRTCSSSRVYHRGPGSVPRTQASIRLSHSRPAASARRRGARSVWPCGRDRRWFPLIPPSSEFPGAEIQMMGKSSFLGP